MEWNCHTCHYLKITVWAVRPFDCWKHNKIACNKCILRQKLEVNLFISSKTEAKMWMAKVNLPTTLTGMGINAYSYFQRFN